MTESMTSQLSPAMQAAKSADLPDLSKSFQPLSNAVCPLVNTRLGLRPTIISNAPENSCAAGWPGRRRQLWRAPHRQPALGGGR